MLGTSKKGVASRFIKIYVLVLDTEKKTFEGLMHLIDTTSLRRFKFFRLDVRHWVPKIRKTPPGPDSTIGLPGPGPGWKTCPYQTRTGASPARSLRAAQALVRIRPMPWQAPWPMRAVTLTAGSVTAETRARRRARAGPGLDRARSSPCPEPDRALARTFPGTASGQVDLAGESRRPACAVGIGRRFR
jgi:hypothetical protein